MAGTIDGINYCLYGGYNELVFASLGGVYLRQISGRFSTGYIPLPDGGKRYCYICPDGHVWIKRGCYAVTQQPSHFDSRVEYRPGAPGSFNVSAPRTTFAVRFDFSNPSQLTVQVGGVTLATPSQYTVVGQNVVLASPSSDCTIFRSDTKTNRQWALAKYGTDDNWAKWTLQFMWNCHLNYIGEDNFDGRITPTYASANYAGQSFWDGSSNPGNNNPWRMPAVYYHAPNGYMQRNGNDSQYNLNLLPGGSGAALKNIMSFNYDVGGLFNALQDTTGHHTRQGVPGWMDTYDPRYASGLQTFLANPAWGGVYGNHAFFVEVQWDDTDNLHFYNAGRTEETGSGNTENYFHGGYAVLISAPEIFSGFDTVGQLHTYSDRTNYTKQALINFLRARYGNSIANLNAAWNTGGYYTSFDSAGGWRVGTGVMDEDGRARTWLGGSNLLRFYNSLLWNTTVKQDLDDFLYEMIRHTLQTQKDALVANNPNILFQGPSSAGTPQVPARAPVLRAIAEVCDVLPMGGGIPATPVGMNFIAASAVRTGGTRVGWHSGIYTFSNPDSALYYFDPSVNGGSTQAARGAYVKQFVTRSLKQRTSLRDFQSNGFIFWQIYDQINEQLNWGLQSWRLNPYDGRDYRTPITDPYGSGTTTNAEDRVYGDLITVVKNAFGATLWEAIQQSLGQLPADAPTITQTEFSAGATSVTGVGVVLATVHIYVDGVLSATTTVSNDGTWAATVSALQAGQAVTASQNLDNGGGESALTSPVYCTVNYAAAYQDSFNRTENLTGLGTPWSNRLSFLRLISNMAIGPSAPSTAEVVYDVDLPISDMDVEWRAAGVTTPPAGPDTIFCVTGRAQSTGLTSYGLEYARTPAGATNVNLIKRVGGTRTVLAGPVSDALVTGDLLRLRIVTNGATTDLFGYRNNTQIITKAGDTEATLVTGFRGGLRLVQGNGFSSDMSADDFRIASLPVAPAPPVFTATPYTAGAAGVSGTGLPGHKVTVYVNNLIAGVAVVPTSGAWTLGLGTALAEDDVVKATQYNGATSAFTADEVVGAAGGFTESWSLAVANKRLLQPAASFRLLQDGSTRLLQASGVAGASGDQPWTEFWGTGFEVISQRLQLSSGQFSVARMQRAYTSDDYRATVTLAELVADASGVAAGVIIRQDGTAAQTFLLARANRLAGATVYQLFQCVGGVLQQLGNDVAVTPTGGDLLVISAKGDAVRLAVNGVARVLAQTTILTGRYGGVYALTAAGSNRVAFDTFSLSPPLVSTARRVTTGVRAGSRQPVEA